MPLRASPRPLALVALAFAAACSDSTGAEQSGPPAKIELVSAPLFVAQVGTPIPEPLVARVRDARDRPVRGASVRFTVQQGSATLSNALVTTDAAGEAAATLTLGTAAGEVSVTANVTGGELSVRFSGVAQPGSLARLVVLPKPLRLRGAADSARLAANLEDQYGNSIPSGAITWRSLDESIATVDAAGMVRGQKAGFSTRVVASSSNGKADTVLVSVADPSAPACASAPVTLAVGQALTMAPSAGTCIFAPVASEYVAIPYFASNVPSNQTDEMRIVGSNISPVTFSVASAERASAAAAPSGPQPDLAFEATLRRREREELAPLVARSREARMARIANAASASRIPSSLAVGDVITLNASASSACTTPNNRTGRVVAITQKAVVVADTSNPRDGFSDADYLRLGRTFDTLVVPVNEQLFGTPGDIDGNGRSVIFYTRAVNQLTQAGSGSYIGGFYWNRDLLERTACPTSNVGEIFYMLVPDPAAQYGNAFSKAFVEQVTVGTLAHEYQHLINASRRMANPLAEPGEVAWLNEGLSHIAEEMVFYRVAGTSPRSNLGAAAFGTGGTAFESHYLSYAHSNIGRLRLWLLSPETNTPFASNDGLATRGAAWAFLRWLADRRPTDGDIWYRLVNSPLNGISNIETTFGIDLQREVRNWAIAMYADGLASNLTAEHTFPSWDLRSAFPVLPAAIRGSYPLTVRPLNNDAQRAFFLRGGSSAYFPFAIGAGREANIQVLMAAGGAPPAAVSVTILRVR